MRVVLWFLFFCIPARANFDLPEKWIAQVADQFSNVIFDRSRPESARFSRVLEAYSYEGRKKCFSRLCQILVNQMRRKLYDTLLESLNKDHKPLERLRPFFQDVLDRSFYEIVVRFVSEVFFPLKELSEFQQRYLLWSFLQENRGRVFNNRSGLLEQFSERFCGALSNEFYLLFGSSKKQFLEKKLDESIIVLRSPEIRNDSQFFSDEQSLFQRFYLSDERLLSLINSRHRLGEKFEIGAGNAPMLLVDGATHIECLPEALVQTRLLNIALGVRNAKYHLIRFPDASLETESQKETVGIIVAKNFSWFLVHDGFIKGVMDQCNHLLKTDGVICFLWTKSPGMRGSFLFEKNRKLEFGLPESKHFTLDVCSQISEIAKELGFEVWQVFTESWLGIVLKKRMRAEQSLGLGLDELNLNSYSLDEVFGHYCLDG